MQVGVHGRDSRVHDALALDEIELYGDVVIAASESAGPFAPQELDRVLGVSAALGAAQPNRPEM